MRRFTKYSIRTLILLTIVTAIGLVVWQNISFPLAVVEAPRPNSGTYTTKEARSLLPKFLAESRGIPIDHELITDWKNPTFGFHVHIRKDGTIIVNGPLGDKTEGLRAVSKARDLALSFLDGNPASVLMTSETNGWKSRQKNDVMEVLFDPAIQIYVIHRE